MKRPVMPVYDTCLDALLAASKALDYTATHRLIDRTAQLAIDEAVTALNRAIVLVVRDVEDNR